MYNTIKNTFVQYIKLWMIKETEGATILEINTIIGNNLKKLDKKKLTLDELAGITGVSKGMLSQIEKEPPILP